jgi:hypothetical protein
MTYLVAVKPIRKCFVRETALRAIGFERFFLRLQGGLSESSGVIDHPEFAAKLAQAKEAFDREIATLRQVLV